VIGDKGSRLTTAKIDVLEDKMMEKEPVEGLQ
jgi:hypothetical protein